MAPYIVGFDDLVTSFVATIATGWSDPCRVGLSPTGKPRLYAAHEKAGLGAELASRTIVGSVDKLGGPSTEIAKHLKKFAMIAADVGVNDFNFITLPLLRKLDVDVTNYGTRSDDWLDMSARVWDQRRLGQGGDETYKDPFITSIDLDRGDFGHHLLGVRDLVEDLGDWLTDNKAPYEDSRGRRWVPQGVRYYQMR